MENIPQEILKKISNFLNIHTGFSCQRIMGISMDFKERFLRISADLPQNGHLGQWVIVKRFMFKGVLAR